MFMEFGNFYVNSDFDLRIVKEDDEGVDLFVDLNYRTLEIDDEYSDFFNSRIQFPLVRGLIIKLDPVECLATIHLLRDIDLFSAFANFEIDCFNRLLSITADYESVRLELLDEELEAMIIEGDKLERKGKN